MTVVKEISRPDRALLDALAGEAAATLHEAMGRRGAMTAAIKPLHPGLRLAGPAVTVSAGPTDNLMIHVALAIAKPGDVLVVDYKAMVESGPWGDLMTASARARGIAGLVIDGCVRDADAIGAMGFPVFCRGTCMKGTTKVATDGDVNLPVTCGGVVVAPGDIVVADGDGVVVVPLADAEATLVRARERTAKEDGLRTQLEAGRTTIELLKLEAHLKAAGIEL